MDKRITHSLKGLTDKMKDKQIVVLIIAVLIGICLMWISSSGEKKSNTSSSPSSVAYVQAQADIEEKLKKVITQIDGVGEMSLMVTYEDTGTAEYITDGTEYSEKTQTSSGTTTNKSSKDKSVVVDGTKDPVLKSLSTPKVKGVVIVCEGGENPVTKERVINAISTVLQIGTDKIYVTQTQRKRGEK